MRLLKKLVNILWILVSFIHNENQYPVGVLAIYIHCNSTLKGHRVGALYTLRVWISNPYRLCLTMQCDVMNWARCLTVNTFFFKIVYGDIKKGLKAIWKNINLDIV